MVSPGKRREGEGEVDGARVSLYMMEFSGLSAQAVQRKVLHIKLEA